MVVFVKNRIEKPLMPTTPARARHLLKQGRAKVVSRAPFVIKMLDWCGSATQEVVAGMDTGSKVIGVAAVSNGEVIYQSGTHLRGEEIRRKIDQRRMYRRTRRGRKTRYRKPRFLNREASIAKGRLAPSVRHKAESHFREKRFVESILPISRWKLELAQFDIHAITNPKVSKHAWWTHQNGAKKGFYNTKAFILHRDGYKCQSCGGKSKDQRLEIHHVIFRSEGGTDSPENLVTLCSKCHKKVHAGEVMLKKNKKSSPTKHATEVNIVAAQICASDWKFEETFGFETKLKREQLDLPKEHYFDAVAICLEDGEYVNLNEHVLIKRLVSKGDYQQTSGAHSQKKIPTGKLFGLRKFDLVKTEKGTGFVKGKRSTGYFAIADALGNPIHASVNIKKNTSRAQARGTALIQWRRAFLPAVNDGVSSAVGYERH